MAVFDGSEPPTREDLELAQRCTGRPAIALINKEDKPTQFDAELIAPCFAMVLPVCCQEEESRKVISAAVARLLGTSQIDPMPPVCPASVSFPPHCVRGTLWPVHWMLPQAALGWMPFPSVWTTHWPPCAT